MAEAAILAALQLLRQALSSELVKFGTSQASKTISLFSNLEVRMNNISSELRVMQAFLDEIDMLDQSNKTRVAWVGEVQKIANQIKDIVDEFIYLVGNQKFGGVRFYLNWIFKSPKSLVALKQIASRLERAEMSLRYVGEMKERWSISNARIGTSADNANESSVQVAISSHFIDEHEILGIEKNITKLTSLINSPEANLSVISVWGMAGVGKTTLVTNVFKRESKNFTSHAWICISQMYKVDHVLRNLISEICKNEYTPPINTDTMDIRGLKETIRGLLQQKRYLIILDDVWDQKSFHDISDVFVHSRSQQRSRIVITSRIADVATLARECNILELKPLLIKESVNLFCIKAFPFETNHKCPSHLETWAKQIISRCNGLPLALVSLGSVLSSCAKNESEWKRIHDQLSWELENNMGLDRLRNVLKLSFNYLPRYLKNCFLYCSMFPEDYLIARKKVIRLWIAEGFVQERGGSTLEETAEGYLLELINRCMLQVVERNYFGRAKRCRMHDTLRELAISICMRENFGLLHKDTKPVNINESTRRLSIVKSGNSIDNCVPLQQLRTVISFDFSMHSSILTSIIKYRCLTVLSLENMNIESVPDDIGNLFNLHYLGLRNTKVQFLPNSIEKLHNLQTLDLMHSKIQEIPDGIVQLKKLRHLFVEEVVDSRHNSFQKRTGIYLPKGVFCLKELQTLQAVESDDMVVKELGNLTQLTSLRIWNVKENQSAQLCRSLSKMSSISFLSINASHENEFLQLDGLHLTRIQKLDLWGRLKEKMLESLCLQIPVEGLRTLRLGWSQLQKNPLPFLSKCENLTYLCLQRVYEGRQLTFQMGWFPKLKKLILIQMPNLVQLEMEQGTMVSLEEIVLWELEQLVDISTAIVHLNSLKWMGCKDVAVFDNMLAKGNYRMSHFICTVF